MCWSSPESKGSMVRGKFQLLFDANVRIQYTLSHLTPKIL